MAEGQDLDDHETSGDVKSQEINGFNFDALTEKHPNDKDKLAEFKQFLLDENNPMAPLKVGLIFSFLRSLNVYL